VQSLTRGLSILECLARAEGGLTLTDVSHRVQLPPSTAHRLLSTLERMGYVYQAGELGRWYVGLQAFAVGSSFLSSRDFVAQSHPYMRRLMDQSGETANLAILDGTEAVFIDQVQCREMMRTIVKLGSRVPLHASGVGKAIFAALPDVDVETILRAKGLPRITAHTIIAPETMWAALRVIRQRGWSFDDEEHALGTRCVGATI
jgi:IclR family acetate operon transcriptional repressor